jgi:hypothetical protein
MKVLKKVRAGRNLKCSKIIFFPTTNYKRSPKRFGFIFIFLRPGVYVYAEEEALFYPGILFSFLSWFFR